MWLSRKTENRRKLALAAKEFRVAASLEDDPQTLVGSKERPLHFLHRRRYLSPPPSSRSGDLLNA